MCEDETTTRLSLHKLTFITPTDHHHLYNQLVSSLLHLRPDHLDGEFFGGGKYDCFPIYSLDSHSFRSI